MRRRLAAAAEPMQVRGPAFARREEQEKRLQQRAEELAREDERQRIGQALHDGTGQMLSLVLLHVGLLRERVTGPERVRLDELKAICESTLDEVRRLSHELHPPTLERLGLGAALAELAASLSSAGLKIALRGAPHLARPLPPEVACGLLRIAQAALGNVARHAQAKRCTLSLLDRRGSLRLEVEDDGRGFDPLAVAGGIGLSGMRERAAGLGGSFSVDSAPGRGTRLRVEVPLR